MVITLPVGPIRANCYIVADERSGTGCVIDPGYDDQRLLRRIEETGLRVSHIILTHGHFDHALGVNAVKEKTGALLYIHAADLAMYESGGSAGEFGIRIPKLPKPDGFLADEQVVDVGGLAMQALHTPGHSKGSVSLYIPSMCVVFTGDLLFASGIGRTDLEGGDTDELYRSIREKIFVLPDSTTVYPGHGASTTVGREKAGNPWLRG